LIGFAAQQEILTGGFDWIKVVYPNAQWSVKTFMHEDDGLLNVGKMRFR
jgi:hypothetical protein